MWSHSPPPPPVEVWKMKIGPESPSRNEDPYPKPVLYKKGIKVLCPNSPKLSTTKCPRSGKYIMFTLQYPSAIRGGTWVAQSVEHLTPDFGSGHDLLRLTLYRTLHWQHEASLGVSLPAPPPLALAHPQNKLFSGRKHTVVTCMISGHLEQRFLCRECTRS